MLNPDPNDPIFCAWAAGFFDGEGCVIVGAGKNPSCVGGVNYVLSVSISQQERSSLDLIAQAWGGSVIEDKTTGSWRKNHTVINRWKISSEPCLPFLQAIQPFAIVKAKQIETALQWPVLKLPRRGVALPAEVRMGREWVHDQLLEDRKLIKKIVNQ